MVLITNGRETHNVTMGAFNSIYKHKGFHIVGAPKAGAIKKEEKKFVAPVKEVKEEAPTEEVEEEAEEEVEAENNSWVDELMEKPISQWSKEEVAKFADAKGIDTSSARKVSEAKEIVKKWIEKNA